MKARIERDIDLSLIDMGKRIREVEVSEVAKLAVSMRDGQLSPIEVREIEGGRYGLIFGAHRLAAAELLGWGTIWAVVVQCSDEDARLREVDENLFRHELTPYDQANFLEERRRVWERMHGEIKRGGDRRSKVQICTLDEELKRGRVFYKETSEKFGLSPDQIKRAFIRLGKIHPDVWRQLKGTEAARNAALLDKVRKLSVDEQREFSGRLAHGLNVKQALRAVSADGEADPADRLFQTLCSAWARADEETRKRFLSYTKSKK